MSNRPFDREIINPLEKPLSDDLNIAQSYHDLSLRFFLGQYFKSQAGVRQDGFISAGLKVISNSPDDMSAIVTAGLGFQNVETDTVSAIDGLVGLNDLESYKPIPLFSDFTFAVPTAPVSPNTRIDIIEVKADRITTDPTSRQVFNPAAGEFQAGTVNKTLQFALDGRGGSVNAPSDSTQPLSYKVGVAANPGVAPTVTEGYIKIAEIAVGSDVTVITDGNITDSRSLFDGPTTWRTSESPTTPREASFFSTINISVAPSDGVEVLGTTDTANTSGVVGLGANAVWSINIPHLQEGDIIENIIVVLDKLDAVNANLVAIFSRIEVDIGLLTFAEITSATALSNETAAAVYKLDYAALQPAEFPITWEEGWGGALTVGVNGSTADILSVTYSVRRSTLRQDF